MPYRRGGCSPDAKQPKEQQEETALCTVFPLAYGVTAENQPFNDSLANDLLIDIKTNLLYYRMIILYIAIILAIIGRFCL
ncbi:hypothetical protein DW080_20635 [Bacteroides caccae]|nr:hypothetical protein DW080_20635 [Bacteroides caccae]